MKLKGNLNDSIMQEEVYEFFLDVTHSLVMYVKKLTKSIKPFLLSLRENRNYSMLASRTQRNDLLKSMKIFKTSIMEVMKTFFKIIDRTKELELCSLAAACKGRSNANISTTARESEHIGNAFNSHQILGQMHQMYHQTDSH